MSNVFYNCSWKASQIRRGKRRTQLSGAVVLQVLLFLWVLLRVSRIHLYFCICHSVHARPLVPFPPSSSISDMRSRVCDEAGGQFNATAVSVLRSGTKRCRCEKQITETRGWSHKRLFECAHHYLGTKLLLLSPYILPHVVDTPTFRLSCSKKVGKTSLKILGTHMGRDPCRFAIS